MSYINNDRDIKTRKKDRHILLICKLSLCDLSSLENVETNKFNAGVFVDVEYQYVIIAEKDNDYIDIEKALEMITDSGYEVASIYTNRTGKKFDIWHVGQ
tara:strand:+ start:2438 stop:2737 length:300 start_codon:yes stop_codon:yes gene_type:complete